MEIMFCQLLGIISLIGWALCTEMSEVLDKPANYIKLGQTPLLSFTPDLGSEILNQICQTRQAKLVTYVSVPFSSKLKLLSDGKPFIQEIMIHDTSILFYRKQAGFDVSTLILSGLPTLKRVRLLIGPLLRDIPDAELSFMVDLHQMNMSHTFSVYVMVAKNQMLKITVDKNMSKQKVEKLTFPGISDPKRVFVYKRAVYVLEYSRVTRLLPNKYHFSKAKVQVVNLKREYTDFALVNETFVFMRGFTTLVYSNCFDPESKDAYSPSLRVHHGQFKYAGFNHYVLQASKKEGSGIRFFYFIRSNGSKNNLKTIHLQILPKKTPGLGSIKRLIQFKHAMYYIYKRSITIQYLNSTADVILTHNKFPGTVYGIIGHYNRLEESLHPLIGIKLNTKNEIRLKKLYVNCLHSELICKQPYGLQQGEKKTYFARALTRKNDLHLQLNFIGAKPHYTLIIPAKPIHSNNLTVVVPKPTPPLEGHNNKNATFPSLLKNLTDSSIEQKKEKIQSSTSTSHPSTHTPLTTHTSTHTPLTTHTSTHTPLTTHTLAHTPLTTHTSTHTPLTTHTLAHTPLTTHTSTHTPLTTHTSTHTPLTTHTSTHTPLTTHTSTHTPLTTHTSTLRHSHDVSLHANNDTSATQPHKDGKTATDDTGVKAIKHWLHYAILICLVLTMGVLCLVRMMLKRQIRGMLNAEDIIEGSAPTGNDTPTVENELTETMESKDESETPQRKMNKPADNELSYQYDSSMNNTINEYDYRHDRPADDSELDNEEPPMPDMTL